MSRTVKRQRKDLKHIEADIYYCSKTDKFLKYNPDNGLYQWHSFPSSKAKPLIGVYYIYDKLHKKYYIGSSINIIDRIQQHKTKFRNNHTSSLMYQSSLCHGDKFIEFGIVELCNKEDLQELEKYYISLSDSINNGWNVSNNTHDCWLRHRCWKTNSFYKQQKASHNCKA